MRRGRKSLEDCYRCRHFVDIGDKFICLECGKEYPKQFTLGVCKQIEPIKAN